MKKAELQMLQRLVFNDTDFESIHVAMKALNWKWISEIDGSESVPSVASLKSKAAEILNVIVEQHSRVPKGGYFIKGAGGFTGEYYDEDHIDARKANTLSLRFDLSNVSLNYKDVVGKNEVDYGLKQIAVEELTKEFTELIEELRKDIKIESEQTRKEVARLKVDVQDLNRQVVDLRGLLNAKGTNN